MSILRRTNNYWMNGLKRLSKHSQNKVENSQKKCIREISHWLIMDTMILKNNYRYLRIYLKVYKSNRILDFTKTKGDI